MMSQLPDFKIQAFKASKGFSDSISFLTLSINSNVEYCSMRANSEERNSQLLREGYWEYSIWGFTENQSKEKISPPKNLTRSMGLAGMISFILPENTRLFILKVT